MIAAIIIIIVLIIMAAVSMTRADIILEYDMDGGKDRIYLTVSAFKGTLKHRIDINKAKNRRKREYELYDKYMHLKQVYKIFSLIKSYLQRKAIVKEVSCVIELGADNAHHTAVLSGIVWTLLGIGNFILFNGFRTDKVFYNVKPNYSDPVIMIDLDFTTSIKVFFLVVVGLKMLALYMRDRHRFRRIVNDGIGS